MMGDRPAPSDSACESSAPPLSRVESMCGCGVCDSGWPARPAVSSDRVGVGVGGFFFVDRFSWAEVTTVTMGRFLRLLLLDDVAT